MIRNSVICAFLICVAAWTVVSHRTRDEPFDDPRERVYVISLPHRHDRRERLRTAIGPSADVRIVDAVDGSKLGSSGPLTKGELGCFHSHAAALERMAAEVPPGDLAVLLEDDADMRPETLRVIRSIAAEAPRGWGSIVLGCNAFPNDPAMAHRISSTLWQLRGFDLYGAHAILYSRDGASAYAAAARRECDAGPVIPWDLWLGRQDGVYVVRPSMVQPVNLNDSDTQRIR